jgi:hypothetical protein
MAVNDVFELVLVTAIANQRAVNVFHFKEVDECSDDLPSEAITAMFEEDFVPVIFLALSIEAVGQCVYGRRIDPTPNIPFLRVLDAVVGDVASDAIPSNAAAVMTQYSVEFGRSGRGRTYLSGIPESGTTDGLINTGQMALLDDISDLFINAARTPPSPFTGSWKPVVWSAKNSEAHNLVASGFSPSPGSMRSRRQPYGMIP